MLKRTLLVAALLSAVCLAQGGKKPTDGAVAAGVYTNRYFAFEYTLPKGLEDRTASVPQDPRGLSYALLYVAEPKQATRAASSVTFFADDAAAWKSKDGAEYLDRFSAQMAGRADLVGKLTSFDIGGRHFWRQDFQPHAGFTVRQTVIATVIKGYVLSVVLTAADPAGVEALLAGVKAMRFHP
ncbi:MAG TPA: hypothetical protein VL382_07345 [Terriglobales bacterium]|nr:hypothetical protein [Terriglobales bacterium]